MNTNPLIEEIWATKARLQTESGGDIHVFCQQLREWSANNIPKNMILYDPLQLRILLAKEEEVGVLVLREAPPRYGENKDEIA